MCTVPNTGCGLCTVLKQRRPPGQPRTGPPRPKPPRTEAITDKQAVLDRAAGLRDAGRIQEALHVVDLLALAPGDDPHVVLVRALKAELCGLRKQNAPRYVSRGCYRAAAKEN